MMQQVGKFQAPSGDENRSDKFIFDDVSSNIKEFVPAEIFDDVITIIEQYNHNAEIIRNMPHSFIKETVDSHKDFLRAFKSYSSAIKSIHSGYSFSENELYELKVYYFSIKRRVDEALSKTKNFDKLKISRCTQRTFLFLYESIVENNNKEKHQIPKENLDDFVIRITNSIKVGLKQHAFSPSTRAKIIQDIFSNFASDFPKITLETPLLQTSSNAENRVLYPKSPPDGRLYKNRDESQNAPEFIRNVYGQWLTGEFTRADLRKIDPKAEMALRNWERLHGRAPLNLPTKKERNDRLLAQAGSEEKPEAAKLHDALRARKRREQARTP